MGAASDIVARTPIARCRCVIRFDDLGHGFGERDRLGEQGIAGAVCELRGDHLFEALLNRGYRRRPQRGIAGKVADVIALMPIFRMAG